MSLSAVRLRTGIHVWKKTEHYAVPPPLLYNRIRCICLRAFRKHLTQPHWWEIVQPTDMSRSESETNIDEELNIINSKTCSPVFLLTCHQGAVIIGLGYKLLYLYCKTLHLAIPSNYSQLSLLWTHTSRSVQYASRFSVFLLFYSFQQINIKHGGRSATEHQWMCSLHNNA